MKIPFFYLNIGNIQVFQPQNDPRIMGGVLANNGTISIQKYDCPEISNTVLFLNGDDNHHNMIPTHTYYKRFFDDPVFLAKWKKLWDAHQTDFNNLGAFIDSIATYLEPSIMNNFNVLSSGGGGGGAASEARAGVEAERAADPCG